MDAIKKYLWNLLVWLDIGLNVLFAGDPRETVSSRAGKAARKGKQWGCVLCKFLDWFEKNHCELSIKWCRHGLDDDEWCEIDKKTHGKAPHPDTYKKKFHDH